MCFDPLSLALIAAGTAASTGGALYANNEANNNAEAQAQARMQELQKYQQKNAQYQKQAQDLLSNSIKGFDQPAQEQKLGNAQAERTQTISQALDKNATATTDVPISGNAPQVVGDEIAKRAAAADSANQGAAAALGRLGGYGDAMFGNQNDLLNSGRNMDIINNFAKSDLEMLPYYQDFAQLRAYKPSSGIGQLLQGLGSVATAAGGSGKFANMFSSMPSMGFADPALRTGIGGRVIGGV